MIKLHHYVLYSLASIASICTAQTFTQGRVAVATEMKDIRENAFSGTVSMAWGERAAREVKVAKNGDASLISGGAIDMSIHDSFAVNYAMAGSAPTGFVSVKTDFSGVEPGKKWSSDYTVTQAPASWCASSNDMTFSSSFKAGDKEPFEIIVNGEKKSIEVFPIYERGYWKRCYSSKVLRKLMYSKDLNMVVSVESAMYSSTTGKPGSVFAYQFTELK